MSLNLHAKFVRFAIDILITNEENNNRRTNAKGI